MDLDTAKARMQGALLLAGGGKIAEAWVIVQEVDRWMADDRTPPAVETLAEMHHRIHTRGYIHGMIYAWERWWPVEGER